MSITEKELIEYGFVKNETDTAIIMPYQKQIDDDLVLGVTYLRNEAEFCIHAPDGVLYLHVNNLDELKIIEQSMAGYEEN